LPLTANGLASGLWQRGDRPPQFRRVTRKKRLQKHALRGKTVTDIKTLAIELLEVEELEDKIAPSGADPIGELD
jgi:hypothetical protein